MSYTAVTKEEKLRELEHGLYIKRSYVEVLELSLAEAAVYAIIRAFSERYKDGFSGSRGYISSLTGLTVKTVGAALASLAERGLILKRYVRVNNREHPAYFADGALEGELVESYLEKTVAAAASSESASGTSPKSAGADGIANDVRSGTANDGRSGGACDRAAHRSRQSTAPTAPRAPFDSPHSGGGNACFKPDSTPPRRSAPFNSPHSGGGGRGRSFSTVGARNSAYARSDKSSSAAAERPIKYLSEGREGYTPSRILEIALERSYQDDK